MIMKTKNEIFYQKCRILKIVEGTMHNLRERRYELLDEVCEIMNDIFISDIKDLGFQDAYFSIDDFECEPELVLRFEEKNSQNDFETEEEWMDYQSNNMEICYGFFKSISLNLDIICLPVDEYET